MEASAVADDVRWAGLRRVSVIAASEAQLPLHHLCGAFVDGKIDEVAAFRYVVSKITDRAFLSRLTMSWGCKLIDGVDVGSRRTLLVHVAWGLLRSRLRRVDLRLLHRLENL